MPTGTPLGLSGGDTAARIFMNAGDSIVNSMRATGQRVQKQVEQSITNRELKAFGQEASTLDPNSPTFVPALMGLAGKYPMASNSPAGRGMIESALMPMQQNALLMRDSARFGQDMALETLRGQNRLKEIKARPNNSGLGQQFRTVPGVGLVNTWDLDENGIPKVVTPQTFNLNEGAKRLDANGNVIAEGGPRTTATPYRFGNGVVGNALTGEFQPLPMTPFQEGSLALKDEANANAQARAAIQGLQGDTARLIQEQNTLAQEGAKTEDPKRKIAIQARLEDIQRRVDRNRSELDTLMRVTADIPVQGPSAGANDPMLSPVPTPQVGGGSVLPSPSWKKYRPAPAGMP